jgi:hypothetical protein
MQTLRRVSNWESTQSTKTDGTTSKKWGRMGTHNRFWNNRRRYCHGVAIDALCVGIAIVVYSANTWVLKPLTPNVFVHGYLNDLFAMPFLISYANLLIWTSDPPHFRPITPIRIAILTIFCCIAWEGVAPLVVQNACSDIFDCAIYSVGAFVYVIGGPYARSKVIAGSVQTLGRTNRV